MPPETMTATLVEFMRQHFSDPNNIEDPVFRDRLWTPEPNSPITIESADYFDPKKIEARNSIIVKDHAWKPQRKGINDQLMGGANPDGSDEYIVEFHSTNTLFCIAGEPREAKQLSTEVTRELVKFGPLLRCQLGLSRFVVAERGECAMIEESTQNYVVPVTIAYISHEQWKIKPTVARLMKVILNVTTKLYGAQ